MQMNLFLYLNEKISFAVISKKDPMEAVCLFRSTANALEVVRVDFYIFLPFQPVTPIR
jgi:hypothetical protein